MLTLDLPSGKPRSRGESDICVNGMFLNCACYFGEPQEHLESVVDFVLGQCMEDGASTAKGTVPARRTARCTPPFPPRWKYNILRSLTYFGASGAPWD